MRDECFAGLLDDLALVVRPEVTVSAQGSPRNAVHRLVEEGIACAIQPVGGTLRETVIGRLEQATHVAYMTPREVRPRDVLVECLAEGRLVAAAAAGDTLITVAEEPGIQRGDRIAVGEGEGMELHVASIVSQATVGLLEPLLWGHEAGEGVTRGRGYEVVAVRDEGGLGHHLRVSLREMTP